MSELLTIEQRRGAREDGPPWIVEGGRRVRGHDHNRRLTELHAGLARHPDVRASVADAPDERIAHVLGALHEPAYVEALERVRGEAPVLLPQFTPPGLAPDTPVSAGLVAAARESVRTAISAALRVLAGARFAYAVCRPPGHHAGPAWLAGYCYLNTAAAAVATLREGGMRAVAVLDLDLHYPNGTSAILAARMTDTSLHSLHAWPVTNAAEMHVLPRTRRERLVEFRTAPDSAEYLAAVRSSLRTLATSAGALVVSLGYDTIAGDPHGSWSLPPTIFTQIGALLAASGLPVCVIQEGGYALATLAQCSHAFATGLLGEGCSVDLHDTGAKLSLEGRPA